MEFHDNYPQYEVMSNHGADEGKKIRRTLWNVFWVMLVITLVELVIGFMAPDRGWSGTWWLKTFFIVLTIAKAAAIVIWFMHLGHEVKFFKYTILAPYIVFILYTIFIVLTEGTYAGSSGRFTKIDPIFVEQQKALNAAHQGGQGAAGHGNPDAAHGTGHEENGH